MNTYTRAALDHQATERPSLFDAALTFHVGKDVDAFFWSSDRLTGLAYRQALHSFLVCFRAGVWVALAGFPLSFRCANLPYFLNS